jgi:hypothetical protein
MGRHHRRGIKLGRVHRPAQWTTEYDTSWFADNGAVDMMPLTGSTWTDAKNVVWDVTASANLPNFGITSAGLGSDGVSASGTVDGYIDATIEEIVNSSGGPAYNAKRDAVEVYSIWTAIDPGSGSALAGLYYLQHSGAYCSFFWGRSAGTKNRQVGHDDNTSSVDGTTTNDTNQAPGVLALRLLGPEVGAAYVYDTAAALTFDSLTTFGTKRYYCPAVRPSAGDDDTPINKLRIDVRQVITYTGTFRMSRLVVKRWR